MLMLSRYWWMVALRGLLLLFGLAAVLWPGVTLTVLVLWIGGFRLRGLARLLGSEPLTASR